MLATLMTLGFAAAALFVLATLGASLARGLAVAAALPGARGEDAFRIVTVRSASTSAELSPARALTAVRPVRRLARQIPAAPRCRQRAAA